MRFVIVIFFVSLCTSLAYANPNAYLQSTFLNREWKEVPGYTHFGFLGRAYWQEPVGEASYWQLGGGYYQAFGVADNDNTRDEASLHARLVWQPNLISSLSLGTLDNAHAIHPALWQEDDPVQTFMAEGIQYRVFDAHFSFDSWLDWQAVETEQQAESFDVGTTLAWRALPRLIVHSQFITRHTGGQNTLDEYELRDHGVALGVSLQMLPLREQSNGGLWLDYFAFETQYQENNKQAVAGSGDEARLTYRMQTRKGSQLEWFAAQFVGENMQTSRSLLPYRTGDYQQLGFVGRWQLEPTLYLQTLITLEQINGQTGSSQGLQLQWQLDPNE